MITDQFKDGYRALHIWKRTYQTTSSGQRETSETRSKTWKSLFPVKPSSVNSHGMAGFEGTFLHLCREGSFNSSPWALGYSYNGKKNISQQHIHTENKSTFCSLSPFKLQMYVVFSKNDKLALSRWSLTFWEAEKNRQHSKQCWNTNKSEI